MTQAIAHILEEVEQLSAEEQRELRNALAERLPMAEISLKSDETWKAETRRRIAELETGTAEAIPGDVVSERIRKIVGR